MKTIGRLLTSNVDHLCQIHSKMIGEKVWVLQGHGFRAEIESLKDSDTFWCVTDNGQEIPVSVFHIRSLDYAKVN